MLSFVTWRRDPRAAVNVTFLACFGLLAAYELTEGAFRLQLYHFGTLNAWLHHANNLLVILVAPTFLHFCVEFPRRGNLPRWIVPACYGVCLLVSPLTFADGFISDRRAVFLAEVGGFVFERRFGPLFGAVNGVPTVVACVALLELLRKLRVAVLAPERTQLQFLLLGTAVTLISLAVTGLVLPLFFGIYSLLPVGNLAPILLCASTAYALATQGMFDIRDTLLRASLALLVPISALASAGIFLRIVYGERVGSLPGGFVAVAAVAVFATQLLLLRLVPQLRILFPGRQHESEQDAAFDRIAADLLLLRSGTEALHAALSLARSMLRAVSAGLFAVPMVEVGTGDKRRLQPDIRRATTITSEGFFSDGQKPDPQTALLLRTETNAPIYFEMVPEQLLPSLLGEPEIGSAFLKAHDIAIAAPLGSSKLRGAVLVGRRTDGRAYLAHELRQLGRIARALGIALENQANHGTLVDLGSSLRRENAALADFSSRLSDRVSGSGQAEIIHGTGALKETLEAARRVAPTDASVVLLGETGTGKELVAEFIHAKSKRARRPLVRVNCAAIPEALIENELFGHERGAFTGADRTFRGRFEQADGGTLFLDEIGELPTHLQVKLLRVIQERRFERLGAERTTQVDVRFVFATHQDLEQRVRDGSFREDLFYRINVISLRIPALRERPEDIPLLVRAFANRFAEQHGLPHPDIPQASMQLLSRQPWPGNVRQLQNVVLRSALATGGTYEPHAVAAMLDVDPNVAKTLNVASPDTTIGTPSVMSEHGSELPANLNDALKETERRLIKDALVASQGNKAEAARRLGLHPPSLIRKLAKLGIGKSAEQNDASAESI